MLVSIQKNKGKCIKFWLPNRFLRSRFIVRILVKDGEMSRQDMQKIRRGIQFAGAFLKGYVRHYGHFTLLEIADAGGTRVSIRI